MQRCPHFMGLEERDSTVCRGFLIAGVWNREVPFEYRTVLISGGWNRNTLLFTDISGSWNRGALLYSEVSSFQGVGM